MENINAMTWAGFVCNVVVTIAFFCMEVVDGGSQAVIFFSIAGAGVILTGVGIAMLVRGDPTGGILGAVGSAVFVPLGLICLIGCLQCRDKLRNATLATADASSSGTVAAPAEEPAVTPESRPAPAEGPATAAAASRSEAAVESADGKTVPEAHAVSESVPDREEPTAEKPLAAFKFVDYSLFFGVVTLFFLAALFVVWAQAPALVGIVAVCAARFMAARAQRKLYVCALYADHLDYASGIWATAQIRVPYAAIVEAVVTSSKLRLVIEKEGRRTNVSVSLSLIPGNLRREACTAIADKMRELGVLREN